jgi:hypothetical protein
MSYLNKSVMLSEDGRYRYHLTRTWDDGDRAVFVMLNPSTADAYEDDPTIRRCIGYARRWGLAGIEVVNLYAYRATNPAELWEVDDPVGPENDLWLRAVGSSGFPLVAAWGANAQPRRVQRVLGLPGFDRLTCLRTTQAGHPGHPLYLPKELTPVAWPPR